MKEDFLKKYNNNFKTLSDMFSIINNDGMSLIRENSGIIYLNKKGCDLLDIDYDNITPDNILEVTSNELRMKHFQNLLSKKYRSVFLVNKRFIGTHDFTTINIEIEEGKGPEELILCRFRDISDTFDRKELEEYLYSEAPIGVFKILYKKKFKFLFGSKIFYDLNNIETGNIEELNKYYRETGTNPLFIDKYLPTLKSAIENYEASSLFEIEIHLNEEESRFLTVQCNIVKIYDDYMIYGFAFDSTSQKLQEIEMNKLHSINKFTIEKDYLNVVIMDLKNGLYQIIASELSRNEIPYKGKLEYLQDIIKQKVLREDIENANSSIHLDDILPKLEYQDSYSVKMRYKIRGRIIWTSIEIRFYNKQSSQILICMRDIDKDEKKKEELILAREKAESANRAKSDFLSRMSHDIRTPLNTIIGMTSLSSMYLDNPEKIKESLKKIDNASKFLLSIINDVLDMSKIESGKMDLNPDNFNFKEFINSVTHISYNSASSKGVDFNITSDPNLKRFYYGDQLRLRQILMNLLSNAIKFTAKKDGKVLLRIDLLSRNGDKDVVRFSIKDNGVGINKNFIDKIFNPFEQEKSNQSGLVGTGLGLSICKHLVKMMNGNINVESDLGKGSTFYVDIPLKSSSKNEDTSLENYKSDVELNVLIIDDDEVTCLHTYSLLKKFGIKADFALNGKDGIEIIEKSIKEDNKYNLIIIDWKMPDMNGYETCEHIRNLIGNDVIIFIMSSFEWAEIEDLAKEKNINYFINKPLFIEDIHYMLQCVNNREKPEKKSSKKIIENKFNGEKILLVEDNEINAEILKSLLECHNLNITVATNGQEALDKFIESTINEYRIILMDIKMPIMNGIEATKQIRKLNRDDATSIPIFALSANAFVEDIENSINAGMNEHLCKPIDIKEITTKIKEYIQNIKISM